MEGLLILIGIWLLDVVIKKVAANRKKQRQLPPTVSRREEPDDDQDEYGTEEPPQAPRSLMAPRALRSPQKAAAPALVQSIAPIEVQAQSGGLLPYAFVALFLVFGLIAVLVFGVKYRARVLGLLLALLIAAAAMVLSVIGLRVGTIYAKPSGDPAAAAEEFLSAVCRDDYDTAYRLLRDYSDLGLGAEPSTAAGRLAAPWFPEAILWEEVAAGCEEASTPSR